MILKEAKKLLRKQGFCVIKEAKTDIHHDHRHYDITYEEALKLNAAGVRINVDGTGAFGENKNTKVYSFNVEDAYGDDPEDYYDDGCVVLSNEIGQSGTNWTEWEAIADQAWVNEEDYQKVFG